MLDQRNCAAPNVAVGAALPADFYGLVQALYMLQPALAALATGRASESEIAAIDRAVVMLRTTPPESSELFVRAIGGFHQAIAYAADNRAASLIISGCFALLSAERLGCLYQLPPDHSPGAVADAIRRRHARDAHDAMKAHLDEILVRAACLMEEPTC